MLILSYFDRRIGPRIFLTVPNDLLNEENENLNILNEIKTLLDRDDRGFFIHTFPQDVITANYTFSLNSKWARGHKESLMITAICSEEDPDYTSYEKIFIRFIEKLNKIPEIYKALYIETNVNEEVREEIQKYHEILSDEFDNTYKILSIKPIETIGQLFTFKELKQLKQIKLSNDILNQLKSIAKRNFFFAYRTRGKVIKLDIIPVDAKEIFNLKVIFKDKMTISIIQEISELFSKYSKDLSLVFTTGICQEGNKCIYEVYIDTSKLVLEAIISKLAKIKEVIEVGVQLINSKSN
ncbi:MAG: hypothetical protein ACFFBP_16175 [Promethearchaeota archaeon]